MALLFFVGSNEQALKYKRVNTQMIDALGKAMLPGFIDTHNHVFEGASEAGGDCYLSPTKTLEQQHQEIKDCQAMVSQKGEWLIGYGHQLDELWGNADDLKPRDTLDEQFPHNPVVIMEESSHSMLVNSLALNIAGFTADTPHPQGGRIMLGYDGEPTASYSIMPATL